MPTLFGESPKKTNDVSSRNLLGFIDADISISRKECGSENVNGRVLDWRVDEVVPRLDDIPGKRALTDHVQLTQDGNCVACIGLSPILHHLQLVGQGPMPLNSIYSQVGSPLESDVLRDGITNKTLLFIIIPLYQ